MFKRKILISCPQCQGGESEYYYKNVCSYCNSARNIDILDHFQTLNIFDHRLENVKHFIAHSRFSEYSTSTKIRHR